jgi:hypothetical protein
MPHHYQKRWVFTWNANNEGQLVDPQKLINFLNEVVEEGVFQQERGLETGRLHFQGRFCVKGPRIGKRKLLEMFKSLGDLKNLTFSPERVYNSTTYCVKVESRVAGPWFVGTPQYRRKNTPMSISLGKWQQQLLNELYSPLGETFKDRKVIWIQDECGGAGKSTFLKYLCSQKEGLNFKKLPLDRPDRIRMMVCKITEKEDVDAFCFDFTRTLDENTSIRSMFQVLEEIKNGHIVSAMFGAPMESIIPCPFVIIFTNEDVSGYYNYLSKDRWQVYAIIENELLAITKFEPHDQNSRFVKLTERKKKN